MTSCGSARACFAKIARRVAARLHELESRARGDTTAAERWVTGA